MTRARQQAAGPGGPVPDERELVAAYRQGDRQAGERLVERTYRQIYGALFRLTGGDADLAADLTQESYRRAWQALPRFRGRSAVSTWLYRIAYTTYLNHLRRPRPAQSLDEAPRADPHDPEPSPRERAETAAARLRLRRAVLALAEDLRFTVTARFWGELPVREIARLCGITPAAVRKRLNKATRILAETLQEDTP